MDTPTKLLPLQPLYTPNLLTYTLQIVTSNNMALEEHIGLIYNSMVCCTELPRWSKENAGGHYSKSL